RFRQPAARRHPDCCRLSTERTSVPSPRKPNHEYQFYARVPDGVVLRLRLVHRALRLAAADARDRRAPAEDC
ncbi:MAG: hypothetical protein ACK55Z_13250, partial [bacterium]